MSSKILLRRGTATQWSSANPILGNGELGIETDTLKIKIGNGTSTWSQLTSYANITPSELTSEINNLINAAPSTLDTLNELAAAINNDASFSTTVNNLLTGKVSKSGGDTITSATTSTKGLIIKGASSQTASLLEWQDSSGNILGRFHPTAGLLIPGLSNTNGGASPYINFNTTNFTLYPNLASNIGLIIQGAASQTGDLQRWQDSSGNKLSYINASGQFISNVAMAVLAGNYGGYVLNIQASNPSYKGILVKGAASQTANLQEWQNSSGTVLAKLSAYGDFIIPDARVAIGASSVLANTFIFANTSYASYTPIVVRGAASQTANLTEWQDSTGTVLTKVDSSGAIYLINPTANNNSNDTPSPAINFQGNIWNSAYGNQNIKGAIKVAAYTGNINPTISKMSFLLATDNGTPAEVASFTNTGAFSNIGGLDAYGTSVIFRLRNTTPSTGGVNASPKLELMGTAWNSSQGNVPSRAYLQVNVNNTNQNPFINRLGFFVATGNNAGGWVYGADATEYMSILGNGTVGINSTTPSGTLDVRSISASNIGAVIRGAASQTANLQEWQLSNGFSALRVLSGGSMLFGNTNVDSNNYLSFIKAGGAVGGYAGIRFGSDVDGSNQQTLTVNTGNTHLVLEHKNASGAFIIKGAASQTANLQEWQNSSGTVLASVDASGNLTTKTIVADGNLRVYYAVGIGAASSYLSSSYLAVQPGSATDKGLVIRGATSQSANLQEWQNSAGTSLVSVQANGRVDFQGAYIDQYGQIVTGTTLYANNVYHNLNYWQLKNDGSANFNSQSASTVGLTVKAAASQTANLQEWQNSSGTALGFFASNGTLKANYVQTTLLRSPTDYQSLFYMGAENGSIRLDTAGASTKGLVIRGQASQTANLQEWQNSAGSLRTAILSDGSLFSNMYSTFTNAGAGGGNAIYARTIYADSVPIAIRGAASQTANLQEWQNSSGTVLTSVDKDGYLQTPRLVITNGGNIIDSAGTTPYFGFGSNQIAIYTRNAAYKGLIIQGSTSQTANLQEWQNSSGNLLTNIAPNGNLVFSANYEWAIKWSGAQILGSDVSGATPYSLIATPYATNYVPLAIKGRASQTANLTEWQGSGGNSYTVIDAYGALYASDTMMVGPKANWSTDRFATGGLTIINRGSASSIPFGVRGAASQTANLTEWQNSAGTVLSRIDSTGALRVDTNTVLNNTQTGGTTALIKVNYADTVPLIVQGAASQTANLQEWLNSAGTVLASVNAYGGLVLSNAPLQTTYIQPIYGGNGSLIQMAYNSTTTIRSNGITTVVPLTVKAVASQTANLQEWQNSSGTVLAKVDTNGSITAGTNLIVGNATMLYTGGNYYNSTLSILTQGAGYSGIVVRGQASQTANLQEWQNSAGTVLANITASGSLELNGKDIELMNIMGAF